MSKMQFRKETIVYLKLIFLLYKNEYQTNEKVQITKA
jgi:uncharacterized membrane protein